jgi:hypothetical protein
MRTCKEEEPMSSDDAYARPPRAATRRDIELMIAVAWNEDGARRGLSPLAWHLGDTDYVLFIGHADAYAREVRRDIVEARIADLGLADAIDVFHEPLARRGSDMVWTGEIDGIGIQLSYPAAMAT